MRLKFKIELGLDCFANSRLTQVKFGTQYMARLNKQHYSYNIFNCLFLIMHSGCFRTETL